MPVGVDGKTEGRKRGNDVGNKYDFCCIVSY